MAEAVLVGNAGEFRPRDFWTPELKAVSKGLRKLRQQLDRCVRDSAKEIMTLVFTIKAGEYRSAVRARDKELREKYLQVMAGLDTSAFLKVIRNVRRRVGNQPASARPTLEAFEEHFNSIYSSGSQRMQAPPRITPVLTNLINSREVRPHVDRLPSSKATSLDEIPGELLRLLAEAIVSPPPMTALFNAMLK